MMCKAMSNNLCDPEPTASIVSTAGPHRVDARAPRPGRRHRAMTGVLLGLALLAMPVHGDWLITLEGGMIETQGPYVVEGEQVTYTDLEGQPQTLDLAAIDLEGSDETTALRNGVPYVPRPRPAAQQASAEVQADGPEKVASDKVTLYMTNWCGYCKRARALLKSLEVPFEERNVEHDRDAAVELQALVGGRSPVPVLDIGGTVVRGYDRGAIKRSVRELKKRKEAAEADGR